MNESTLLDDLTGDDLKVAIEHVCDGYAFAAAEAMRLTGVVMAKL